uniref:Uncharacterized protein n=1 Tax=Cucumis sativus TaxID=3659 RepID=A0A0A0KS93_CUCSA
MQGFEERRGNNHGRFSKNNTNNGQNDLEDFPILFPTFSMPVLLRLNFFKIHLVKSQSFEVVFLNIAIDLVDSLIFVVPYFQKHFSDTSDMNMVPVTLRDIRPSITTATFFDALLIAPQAFLFHILVKNELQFFFSFSFSFDCVFSLQISTTWVKI